MDLDEIEKDNKKKWPKKTLTFQNEFVQYQVIFEHNLESFQSAFPKLNC